MAHALGMARTLPGVPETLTEHGEQPYEGIVLGQYQSRPLDMAIALATLTNDGVWHQPHFVERVETATGEVLYEADHSQGERRVNKTVAQNTINAMEPIAAWSGGKVLAGGRPSASKTGTTQLGDTGYNQDAGWSGPPRNWQPPSGWARRITPHCSPHGVARCTAPASRPTSGSSSWTKPTRARKSRHSRTPTQ